MVESVKNPTKAKKNNTHKSPSIFGIQFQGVLEANSLRQLLTTYFSTTKDAQVIPDLGIFEIQTHRLLKALLCVESLTMNSATSYQGGEPLLLN